jgi:hypothetical protein
MRSIATLAGSIVIGGASLVAADVLTQKLSAEFARKVVVVQAQSETKSKTPRATTFTEAELNSYLKFDATDLLPTGLAQPSMTLIGQNRITARAVVDLDVVRQKQGSGSWFDPTSYLTGKLPVSATGRVVTGDRLGRFEYERVEISGVAVPKSLLAQMVNYFTRTADNPRGMNIDDTVDLPARIERIDVNAGRFVVIQ